MTSFSCQRCRQPILLSRSLSSSHEEEGGDEAGASQQGQGIDRSVSSSTAALTQSTYDLMQSEAFLVRHVGRPGRGAVQGGGGGAAATAASKRGARQRGLLGGLAAATFTSSSSSSSSPQGADSAKARDEARIKALTSRRGGADAAASGAKEASGRQGLREEDKEVESVREALKKSAEEKRERRAKGQSGVGSAKGQGRERTGRAEGGDAPTTTAASEDNKDPTGGPSAKASTMAAPNTTSSASPAAVPSSSSTLPNSLSSRLSLTTSLFSLLSSASSKSPSSLAIDHPLCKECTDLLLELMNSQMEELRRERDAYMAFGDEATKGGERGAEAEEEREMLKREIAELEKSAEAVTRELRGAEADRMAVEEELRALEEEEARLEEEENRFWQEQSSLQTTLSSLSSRRASLRTSIAHDSALLSRLQRTNVYNDAFCIGHDGGFATINGLRLGRLPNAPATSSGGKGGNVDWIEINAAWGQTVLLLQTLARKCGFDFDGYVLHPRGNFSTIEKLPNNVSSSSSSSGDGGATAAAASTSTSNGERTVYELYGSGDWQIGRMFQSRRFDNGMVAFLDCLRQLGEWAQTRDTSLRLPHAINKDRIGEASIRLQFGSDENWTRALRHVLLTLKVLLSWAVNSADDDDEENEDEDDDEGEKVKSRR